MVIRPVSAENAGVFKKVNATAIDLLYVQKCIKDVNSH